MRDEREQLQAEDAWTRAKRAGELINRYQDEVTELSRIRREAIEELLAAGSTQSELATFLELTRARMSRLLSSGPKPSRAFLGTGSLMVAIGGKESSTSPSAVISAESMAAYHTIKDLAGEYGLDAEYEIVPPPGIVRLNRANLVVVTSPRTLPLVGQVLEADPHLAFENGAQGWYLRDRTQDTIYRSPSDANEPRDYAYVGRLPRPDGKGTFLYLAGIHAMGTKGAARYLADNAEDLYQQVKTRRWSVLIECRYHPDSREIESTERLTPIYTP